MFYQFGVRLFKLKTSDFYRNVTGWLIVKDIGIGGLEFTSRASQIGYSVVNGSAPLRSFFGDGSCVAQKLNPRDGPRHSLHALV